MLASRLQNPTDVDQKQILQAKKPITSQANPYRTHFNIRFDSYGFSSSQETKQ